MSDYSRAKQEHDAMVARQEYIERIELENKKLKAKVKRLENQLAKLKKEKSK